MVCRVFKRRVLLIINNNRYYYSGRYAHYDNDPGFDDFSPFGGWSYPNIKQYAGDASVCGKSLQHTCNTAMMQLT